MTEYPNVNGRGGIRWCYPVLPLAQYSVQTGCGYLDPGYYLAIQKQTGRGSVHPGCDYNGLGGGNTDLGDSIHAAADGIVMEAGEHRVWGWVIVIRHEGVGGGYGSVETQYAHPEKAADVLVRVGQRVKCGDVIARIGRGGKNSKGLYYYYAHLHFEVRTTLGLPGDEWPSTTRPRAAAERYIAQTRDDPQKFLAYMQAAKTLAELSAPTVPVPAVPAPAPAVKPPRAVGMKTVPFDLGSVELLDRSGNYVPLPGGDVIYQGLRITRNGSRLRIQPEVKQ